MSATLSSRSGRAGGLVCKTPSWMPDDVQEVDRAVGFPRFRPAFLAEVADAVPPQSGSQSGSRIRLAATAGAGRESAVGCRRTDQHPVEP